MVQTTSTLSYSTFSINTAVVLAVEILRVYSVLEMTRTAVARTPLMHVARTTSSVLSRYPSTRFVESLICSVSSWFSFRIPMRTSKQSVYTPLLCNRAHSEYLVVFSRRAYLLVRQDTKYTGTEQQINDSRRRMLRYLVVCSLPLYQVPS